MIDLDGTLSDPLLGFLRDHFLFVSGGDIGIEKWQQIESLLAQGSVSTSSVMVGDRSVDIAAAHRNRLYSAGVLWGYGSRSEIENERPNYLFASPTELPSLVMAKNIFESDAANPRTSS